MYQTEAHLVLVADALVCSALYNKAEGAGNPGSLQVMDQVLPVRRQTRITNNLVSITVQR